MATKSLTIWEIKRRLVGNSKERERLVKLLIQKIREDERAKLAEAGRLGAVR